MRTVFFNPSMQVRVKKSSIMNKLKVKASVMIVAGFCPEFHPPFLWRSKHQTRNDCEYQ